ncbi:MULTISPECIES: phage tail protein [Bacillus]|uniref:phage tail protein n=1 Tax=Bacillus TaxID=1386 RepID=UPI0002EC71D0|nr:MULTISPECIES: hypothetical protein [Bacillus]
MAGNIKGITIELGADTTKLGSALKDVNSESIGLQKELKQVEKLLKFDPGNTELVAQKQQILAQNVEATTKKLDTLKQAQAQVDAQFAKGDISAEQYRAFQREVSDTEQSLKSLKGKLEEVSKTDADLKADDKDIKKATDSVEKLGDEAEKSGKRGSAAFKALGGAAVAAVAGIGGLVAASAELNTDLARLEANALNAGFSMEGIEKNFAKVAAVSGEADSAVETLSNLMATGFNDQQMSQVIDEINGAAIRFSDTLKTEGIADGLQETFATGEAVGQFGELLERSGVSLDTFNAGLAQAKKNGTETDYVLQQLAELGLASTYEEYQKSNAAITEYNSAQVALQMAVAGLGERLMPLVTMVMNLGVAFLDWTNKAFDAVAAMNLFSGGITATLPQMIQAGVEMIQNMITGITNNLPQITETVITLINQWLATAATMYPLIIEAGVQIISSLIQGIADNLPIIVEGIVGVFTALVETATTLLPQIIAMGASILTSLVDGIVQMLPSLIDTALDLIVTIVETIVGMLPEIVNSGIKILNSVIDGILKILPQLVPTAVKVLDTLIKTIIDNLPKIIDSGMKLLNSLIDGIIKVLPSLVATTIQLIASITKTIWENLPEVLSAGIKIVGKLIEGLVDMIPDLIIGVGKLIKSMVDKFDEIDLGEVGKNIIRGLINGISNMKDAAIEAISGVVGGVIDKAKSLLDTHSPSRVFEEIGENTNEGYILGVEKSSSRLMSAIDSAYGSLASSAQGMMESKSTNYNSNSYDYSRNVYPTIKVTAGANANEIARANERSLRRLAFQFN